MDNIFDMIIRQTVMPGKFRIQNEFIILFYFEQSKLTFVNIFDMIIFDKPCVWKMTSAE